MIGRIEAEFRSGGVRCAATLYRADDVQEQVPCVVMGPGGTLTRRDGIPAYAERFADLGVAALAFDYRHWGDSDGEPRGWFSIPKQLEDWRAAVAYARTLETVDPDRVAVWGMSFAGGYVLVTAADDQRVAAVLSLVGLVDGLAFMLRPVPPLVIAQSLWRATREVLTRRPVTMPVAGPPGTLAVCAAPEGVEGFLRTTFDREPGHEWRNEVNTSPAFSLLRHRPVRRASTIKVPVLLQLGENDGIVPLKPIEKAAARAPRGELIRYPMDHFGCFTTEHIDRVAGDQLDFIRRHLVPQPEVVGR